MYRLQRLTGAVAALALLVAGPVALSQEKEGDAFGLLIKRVQVAATDENDEPWDINDGKPDLVIVAINHSDKQSQPFFTREIGNALQAEFNTAVTFPVRAGQKLELRVLDRDVAVDDTIGAVQKELTADDLERGLLRLENFGRVLLLEIEFQKKK